MFDAMRASGWRRRLAVATACAVSLAALTACTESSAGSRDGSADGGGSTARTIEPGQAASDQVVDLLTVGIPGQVPTLNPNENIASGQFVNGLAMETLLRIDQDGNLQPWLATDWEVVSDTVYEYTLREGVKFWDGTELTSEDVKFAWDQLREGGQPFFSAIESIDTPDRYTVVVNLIKPNAAWQYTPGLFYSFIYQKAFFQQEPKSFGQPGRLVMGTGPWQVESLTPTTGMELSAYPGYWGGEPPIKRISVKSFADENAMALALRADEVDIAMSIAQPKNFDAAAGGDVTTTASTCAIALLGMPTQTAPFDDVHVRRAVAHAINRDDIVAAKQGGAGDPLTTLIPPAVLASLADEDEVEEALDGLPKYEFDLEKAREEMAQSKVPDGFEFEFLTTSMYARVAQVIAAQLAEINIDVEVNSVGDTEYTTKLIGEPKERPLTFSETGACTPDPSWNDLWLGSAPEGGPSTLNFANFTPPRIDELQDEGLATVDPAERLDIYTEILDIVGTEVPYVPLYEEGTTYASADYELQDFGSYWSNTPWALNLVPQQ